MHGDDERLDWQLIAPVRPGSERQFEALSRQLSAIEARAGADGPLSGDERERYEDLLGRVQACLMTPCESVGAPLTREASGWEHAAIDDFEYEDTDHDLDEYLQRRGSEADCARCPYGTPYSEPPMLPCEFAAGRLREVLPEGPLRDRVGTEMEPSDMLAFASSLEAEFERNTLCRVPGLDGADYVSKAVLFLRFWAERGFALAPCAPPPEEPEADVDEAEEDAGLLEAEPDACTRPGRHTAH